jgi:TPR repeat protein
MRQRIFAAVALGLTSCPLVSVAAQTTLPLPLITACDRLAASPSDITRPSGVPGVVLKKISPASAIAACEEEVALQPGNARLHFQLGRAYATAGKPAEAAAAYTHAADAGHLDAMNNLAILYLHGRGSVLPDTPRAISLLAKAAEGGNSMAMRNLAEVYDEGKKVDRDPEKAHALYTKAAATGDASAMFQLGWSSQQQQDYTSARRWYEKAATAGHAASMTNLGFLYQNGLGVRRDIIKAREWYRHAANLGNEQAARNLKTLQPQPGPRRQIPDGGTAPYYGPFRFDGPHGIQPGGSIGPCNPYCIGN